MDWHPVWAPVGVQFSCCLRISFQTMRTTTHGMHASRRDTLLGWSLFVSSEISVSNCIVRINVRMYCSTLTTRYLFDEKKFFWNPATGKVVYKQRTNIHPSVCPLILSVPRGRWWWKISHHQKPCKPLQRDRLLPQISRFWQYKCPVCTILHSVSGTLGWLFAILPNQCTGEDV